MLAPPTAPMSRPRIRTGYVFPLYVSVPEPQVVPTPIAADVPLSDSFASGFSSFDGTPFSSRACAMPNPSASVAPTIPAVKRCIRMGVLLEGLSIPCDRVGYRAIAGTGESWSHARPPAGDGIDGAHVTLERRRRGSEPL